MSRPRPFAFILPFALALVLLGAAAGPAAGVDTGDTRLLVQPAVSAEHVAFLYAGDLWVARRDGDGGARGARRLTTHPGRETSPAFSPDGRTIAFSGEYDGNVDVYLVPVEGGAPTRLTWHPADDIVQDFTPDGGAVLFVSQRVTHTRRHAQLFTVPVAGGMPRQLPIPNAMKAAYSDDGGTIAYLPQREVFRQWKNYRGGTTSRIWLYDVADHSVVEVPQPPGRANDTDPMWLGGRLYFLSDRAGEFNLFSWDPADPAVAGEVVQHTAHDDFPVLAASTGGGVIAYEQAGYLHLFDPADGEGSSRRLPIGVAADLVAARPRYISGAEPVRSVELSPSGARAVLGYRGEVVTVPAEKGSPRNLTDSPGAHERHPVWSPDGRRIAYFSDAGGEYQLHVATQDGRGEVRRYPLGGSGFYEDPKWSPDSQKVSFIDNSWTLYWIDLASGAVTEVSSEVVYGPIKTLHHAWSPDSRWLAYTRNTPTYFQQLHLYSLEENRSHAVTEGLSDVNEPVFDAGGKYLYFFASTDAGPVRSWFDQSNADMRLSGALYLAVLPSGEPSPFAPESDEERAAAEDRGEVSEGSEGDAGAAAEPGADEPPRVTIDLDRLAQRIVALPVPAGAYWSLTPGAAGELYYLKSDQPLHPDGEPPADPRLVRFSLEDREETKLADGVRTFSLSANTKKLLVGGRQSWRIVEAGGEIPPRGGELDLDAVAVRVEPRAEWAQIYDEAWRINRDYFYDPGMHGADWPAIREKYAAFLPHLTDRRDLDRVMQWMASELSVGHHFLGGGDYFGEPEEVPGGLLGADYEVADGRYRFARVYGGLNWVPDLSAPLTQPGVDVEAGEYLLAVDGEPVRPPENLYRHFEHTAGRVVELTVGPHADGTGARTVTVVPIEDERELRARAWVEANLRRVTEATGGRVAYVWVPNTAGLGYEYFKRYFFPQADRQAIIVDERYNAGGSVADYYIDLLRRPLISYWTMRYGQDIKSPLASIQGPKVMIVDEGSGSGGDLLPWMFRKLEMGTIVGKRTWGGLVGILGFPELMDGGGITAPNLGFWTPEDGWAVENEGVAPDIEVEQTPAEVIAGRDPQLEKAIEVALAQLAADPPTLPARPPFPVRVRQ